MRLKFKKDTFYALLSQVFECINSLDADKSYELIIEKEQKRRSNDANAYYWTLLGKLSAQIHIPPQDIYRNHIKDVGGNYEVIPIRDDAKETWIKNWRVKGMGWVCEELGESKLRGYTNVICFYGSSTYDTKQMSRLIDLCVQDCKAQGIETLTPNELALMLREGPDE